MKWVLEDVAICLTVTISLAISLSLSLLLVIWDYPFPPSLITFFAGISVAALIYRFLGGSQDAKIAMGIIQVSGSAALLFGITFLLGDKISTQMGLFKTSEQYRK